MKYKVILADCPWQYYFANGYRRAIENHYSTMSDADLASLGNLVQEVSDKDTVLFMWATAPKLLEALDVMKAWGFKYATSAVWDKELMGPGHWFRMQHELLLVGRVKKTRCTPVPARRRSVFRERRSKEHSRKPECVMEWIEEGWPDATKLELFGRRLREGWTVLGNEIDGKDIRVALKEVIDAV